MINIKNLRDDIDTVASALATRGYELNKEIFIELEGERKVLQVEVESLQSDRKNLSKEMIQASLRIKLIKLIMLLN